MRLLRALAGAWAHARKERLTRNELRELCDRMLLDIGLRREQVQRHEFFRR